MSLKDTTKWNVKIVSLKIIFTNGKLIWHLLRVRGRFWCLNSKGTDIISTKANT